MILCVGFCYSAAFSVCTVFCPVVCGRTDLVNGRTIPALPDVRGSMGCFLPY